MHRLLKQDRRSWEVGVPAFRARWRPPMAAAATPPPPSAVVGARACWHFRRGDTHPQRRRRRGVAPRAGGRPGWSPPPSRSPSGDRLGRGGGGVAPPPPTTAVGIWWGDCHRSSRDGRQPPVIKPRVPHFCSFSTERWSDIGHPSNTVPLATASSRQCPYHGLRMRAGIHSPATPRLDLSGAHSQAKSQTVPHSWGPGLSGMRVPPPCGCGWLRWAWRGRPRQPRGQCRSAVPRLLGAIDPPTAVSGAAHGGKPLAAAAEPRWPLAGAECGTGPVAAATGFAFPILRPLLGSRRPAGWRLLGVPRPRVTSHPLHPLVRRAHPPARRPPPQPFICRLVPRTPTCKVKAEFRPRDGDRRGSSPREVGTPACILDRPCSTPRPASAFHGQPRGHALYRGARR